MRGSDAHRAKRIAAGIIALMMLVFVLCSSFYMTAEAGHKCSGENCPVCMCVRQCGNTLRQISSHTALQAAAVISVFFSLLSVSAAASGLLHETPVSKKVRLNN